MMGFWKILEIEPTRDISAIRRAYAQKTRSCHPEENPEDFLELRKAYQSAMDYAEKGSMPSQPELIRKQKNAEEDLKRPSLEELPEKDIRWLILKEQPEESTRRLIPKELPEEDTQQPTPEVLPQEDAYRSTGEELLEKDTQQSAPEELPQEDTDWSIPEELSEEGPNPFRDGEAIRQFVDLYTGKQRRNSKLWMDYFTSGVFLDAAWDSRFTTLLREKITELEQDFPPAGELLMWLEIVYQFSMNDELKHNGGVLSEYPRPKRPGGDELAVRESFKDYRHLIRLAESGSWNEQAMEEFKWIAGRYVSAYIKERCDPKGNPDYQRHFAGLRVFTHFFQRCDLPEELYHIVWRKYDLKSVVMGRAKIFYGPLRELAVKRVPGIDDEEPENFFRLNQDRKECFEQGEGELDAFFDREDVRKALRSRRFVDEQLLSCTDWLNRLTPESAVRRLAEFYCENQDIPGWDQVVKKAQKELEDRAEEQKRKEEAEAAIPKELDLSLLFAFPKRVYVQPLTGPERMFRPDKEVGGTAPEDEIRDDLNDDEVEENAEPLTEEELLALFDRFAGGELERLELNFGRTILALTRDKDKYACFCFEMGEDTWFSLLSQPDIYWMADSKDVKHMTFGMGKMASYNIHENPASILNVLNLVFMQIGRGRIQVRLGDRLLWSSHTSLQNGQFKKHMAMQKLAKIPASRIGDHILSKFVFSQYPARIESISLSGERNLAELGRGNYDLAVAALAQFFQQKLARLRMSWETKGQGDGTDQRHIVLLQDGGRFMMAWLEDGRERADFYASDAPNIFLGRMYPAGLVHRNPSRIRNCLDLILDDMTCADLITDRPGEFVPADRPYAQVRAELVNDTGDQA